MVLFLVVPPDEGIEVRRKFFQLVPNEIVECDSEQGGRLRGANRNAASTLSIEHVFESPRE